MVTPIKAFKKDPNGLGRGAGVYYHRGHGYYSQYSRARDGAKKSTGWRVNVVGIPGGTRFPQITDGNINDYFAKHPQWFGKAKKKRK